MLNARGAQDLVIYVLTANGRVETTNYRTVKVPSNAEFPAYVKEEFARTYKALFDTQAVREDNRAIFTEYFWDMASCDPCAGDPLSRDELRQAGVFWIEPKNAPPAVGRIGPRGGSEPVMLTRLHLRYTKDSLPEDLVFQETQDRASFQARYVLRHPWSGDENACAEAKPYFDSVRERREREAQTLANLTGWDVNDDSRAAWLLRRRCRRNGGKRCGSERRSGSRRSLAPREAGGRAPVVAMIGAARPGCANGCCRTGRTHARDGPCCATRGSSRSRSSRRCFRSACSRAISRSTRGRWRSRSRRASQRRRLWLAALGLRQKGMLSALITCFGLSILLRADTLWVHPLAAALAISSKFVLRANGKHVFNPANIGVIAASVALPGAWVSPGQWGHDIALAGWFVVLGGLVTQRARRWDIAWAFLAAWLAMCAVRVALLGQPWPVLMHQLDNGALLLFAFFMISDPMTIPDRARIANRVCAHRRRDRVRMAVRAVQAQRARGRAVPRLAARPADRPPAARRALRLEVGLLRSPPERRALPAPENRRRP